MELVQIGNRWINAEQITSIHWDDGTLIMHFGEREDDGFLQLDDPAEIEGVLRWLDEATTYVARYRG